MSYDFDGTDDWIGNTTTCPITNAPFTASCWFNADVFDGGALITLSNSSGNDRFQLRITATPTIRFLAVDADVNDTFDSTGTPVVSTWGHACMSATSATSRAVYFNGANKATDTTSRTITGLSRLHIGSARDANTNQSYFNGRIAEVGVWDVALTDDEVASLGQGISCALIRPQSLVFYAPLIRNIVDLSKNNLALTNNGGATVADHTRVYL